jgi:large subunit ribosomal protein L21
MYAIVEIAGQQFKVQKDQKIFVHRLDAEEGKKVSFDKVLLVDNDGKVTLGAPAIAGATVSAKVEEHVKGDKVIVFRKKRRKGYKKKNGHRQSFTAITISDIKVGGAKPAAEKAEKAPKAEKTEAAPKAEAKKPAAKKAPAKKAAPKKDEE